MRGEQPGIWRWAEQLPQIDDSYHMTLGEGDTPLQEVEGLYFKREDLSPSGSVKDRGLAYQMSHYVAMGNQRFVISSSGNAAISAAMLANKYELELVVFVADSVDSSKLSRLQDLGAVIKQDARAVSAAHRYALAEGMINLRPGTDEWGAIGYHTLGYELSAQLPASKAIFFPVSSGTTLVGCAAGLSNDCRLFCVQTSRVHPIASRLGVEEVDEEVSLATGLVARSVPRRDHVVDLVTQSGGAGVIVGNDEIQNAYTWLHEHDLPVSYDAATALAGYRQVEQTVEGPVVVVLTGKERGNG